MGEEKWMGCRDPHCVQLLDPLDSLDELQGLALHGLQVFLRIKHRSEHNPQIGLYPCCFRDASRARMKGAVFYLSTEFIMQFIMQKKNNSKLN